MNEEVNTRPDLFRVGNFLLSSVENFPFVKCLRSKNTVLKKKNRIFSIVKCSLSSVLRSKKTVLKKKRIFSVVKCSLSSVCEAKKSLLRVLGQITTQGFQITT